mgnify:CR=1 FL=1
MQTAGTLRGNLRGNLPVPSRYPPGTLYISPGPNWENPAKSGKIWQNPKIVKNGPISKPHTVISRRIFGENALGIRFYDLAVDNSNVVKGYYKSEIEAGEFVRATAKVADKKRGAFPDSPFFRFLLTVTGNHR